MRLFFILLAAGLIIGAEFTVSSVPELRTALATCETNGENNTIEIAGGTYSITSELVYTAGSDHWLVIQGDGVILSADADTRIMRLVSTWPSGGLWLYRLYFQGGNSATTGGGLYVETSEADIYVESCHFNRCRAGEMGGGMNAVTNGGDITIIGCLFNGCVGVQNAGGLNAGVGTGSIHLDWSYFYNDSVYELIDPESHVGGDGGGCLLYSEGGDMYMTNNYFSYCYSPDDGGGGFAYLLNTGGYLQISGNVCTDNYAVLGGAGLFIRINDSGTMDIYDNTLSGNQTEIAEGAGIFAYLNDGTMTFSDNVMVDNLTAADGGGAWLWTGTGDITVTGNEAHDNTAEMNGGGMSIVCDEGTLDCNHNIFYSNSAGAVGGGMNAATTSGDLSFLNNTSYSNSSEDGNSIYLYFDGASATCDFQNNILSSEAPAIAWSGAGSFTARYSLIEGGTGASWFGTGCIDADPIFVNPGSGDFNLSWASFPTVDATMSPAIDAGNPAHPNDSDGTRIDMGAFYFNQITGSTVEAEYIPEIGDLTVHPNPFNAACQIKIPQGFTAAIYDIHGRHVQAIPSGSMIWNAADQPSGAYLVRAQRGDYVVEKRVVLVR